MSYEEQLRAELIQEGIITERTSGSGMKDFLYIVSGSLFFGAATIIGMRLLAAYINSH